jgi:hypothetical protein
MDMHENLLAGEKTGLTEKFPNAKAAKYTKLPRKSKCPTITGFLFFLATSVEDAFGGSAL